MFDKREVAFSQCEQLDSARVSSSSSSSVSLIDSSALPAMNRGGLVDWCEDNIEICTRLGS